MPIMRFFIKWLNRLGIRARFMFSSFLVIICAMSCIGYYGYYTAYETLGRQSLTLVTQQAQQLTVEIEAQLKEAPQDLDALVQNTTLHRALYWKALGVERKAIHWHAVVLETLRSFLDAHHHYFSIQFFDLEGKAQINIRRRHQLNPRQYPMAIRKQLKTAPFLHDKKQGTFSVSPLELYRKNGLITHPLTPVIHFAQPVIAENGEHYGTMVLQLLADPIFQLLRQAQKQAHWNYYLISKDGDYLFHPDQRQQWGRLLGHQRRFYRDFPERFEKVKLKDHGTFDFAEQVISYRRIFPKKDYEQNHWILIVNADQKLVMKPLHRFVQVFLLLFVVTLFLAFLANRSTVRSILWPIHAITRQLEHLGKGEIIRETITYYATDSLARMILMVNQLLDNTEKTIQQVKKISSGEYGQQVQLLSKQDRLGLAINEMSHTLERNQFHNQQQRWINEGVSQLARELSGDQSLQQLAEKALNFTGRYLESGRGVLYHYEEEKEDLVLTATFMFTERSQIANRLKSGEGAIGQAAKERKPILLKDIQSQEYQITTGTVAAKPLNVFVLPLLYQETLQGVMELASFIPFDKTRQTFLVQLADMIAVTLFSASQRNQVQQLLIQAEESTQRAKEQNRHLQKTNRQMEKQQRQLQNANTQMEEQQQQLQQQTTALQTANSHMEEQQQQLQQQTEELQEANAQMEEQQQQLQQQSIDLTRNNEALRISRDELDARAKQLEEANRYKSDFLANMSHELRTPLNSIIVISKMLAMNENSQLDQETIQRAKVIFDAGNELLRLINDILDLSKIEAGRVELYPETLATTEAAQELQALFQESFKEKHLRFNIEDTFQGNIVTDRHKILQVIRNLLSNALKFTHKGEVRLQFERVADKERPLRIVVSDSGIGIPEDKLQQIFEEFRQVDGSISRQYGGTGLGLTISRRFINLLNGTIDVRSVEGEGSQFIITLPEQLASSENISMAPPVPSPSAPVALQSQPDEMKSEIKLKTDCAVLVIDDDRNFLKTMTMIRRPHHCQILTAQTGKEGLKLAAEHQPSGIILDLGLPDMSGQEVLTQLKTNSDLKDIPIYIISAQDRDGALLEQGALGFLQKPVTDDQIKAAENALLGIVQKQQHKTMLIIEGEAVNQSLIDSLHLKRYSQIRVARSAEEGLTWAQNETFDLILVDHAIEDMACEQFCEKVRHIHPEVALIIYGVGEFGETREATLRQFTDSIIQQAPTATERLLKDVVRFLSHAKTKTETEKSALITSPEISEKLLEGRQVMIVDDDARNLFVLSAALEQHGAEVITALHGEKALTLLDEHSVDLIVMDIMMPEMDGYETIKRIRANERLKNISLIALTAKAQDQDRQQCLAAGADDYLSKPVDYEMLINMAKAWIEKKR
ncbi:response regulator [Magnetococcales bacterium HHB-1]